jgi:hypothetical protein
MRVLAESEGSNVQGSEVHGFTGSRIQGFMGSEFKGLSALTTDSFCFYLTSEPLNVEPGNLTTDTRNLKPQLREEK